MVSAKPLVLVVLLGAGRAAAAPPVDVAAASEWDVVEMKDGTVWRGVIVEQVPGRSYRVVLAGGSEVLIDAAQVARLAREPNPDRAAPDGGFVAAGPPPLAGPGPRLSAAVGVARPDTGNHDVPRMRDDASPTFALRAGYELMWGSAGLTPAAVVEYIRLAGDRDGEPIHMTHAALQLRAAVHLGEVVPFAALGFGVDIASFNPRRVFDCESPDVRCSADGGFGMHFAFGADLLVTRRFALGLQVSVHPAIAPIARIERRSGYEPGRFYLCPPPRMGALAGALAVSLY